jgi:tetratricopeptide (TPR) repeat protein
MSYFSTVAGALREKGDGHLYGMTLNHLSFRFLDCGRLSDCRSMFEDANSMARRLSDQVLEASVAQFRGHYHNEVGEYNIALSVLSAALDKGPSPFDRAALMLFYAMALRHIAPKEDALRALRAALVDAQQYRSVWVQALAMIELAEGLLSHGEIDEVKPIVGEALDLATRIEAKLLVAHLWGLNGRLEMRAGDFRAGEMLLLRSLAVFESAGARLKAAKIKVDLYNLNWIRGEKAAAVQFLKSAHAIFKECDAPIHVAKIEKLAEENSICFV